MALGRTAAEALILLKNRGFPMRNVLMLGRQHMALHPGEVQGVPGLLEVLQKAPELSGEGERFADPFFHALGAESVESLDASDYEACTLVHDMNRPVPEEWHGRYDVVFDGGTLEHVFHFPNAITNAMSLVREGGCFVNCSPCNNYNGHGFYQFSPELFFRLFDARRGYRVVLMGLAEVRHGGRMYSVKDPEELGYRTAFQGNGLLQLVMVATRESALPLSPEDAPFQSDYSKAWEAESGVELAAAGRPESDGRRSSGVKRWIRSAAPRSWIDRYDCYQIGRRLKREATRGLTLVENLESCLR